MPLPALLAAAVKYGPMVAKLGKTLVGNRAKGRAAEAELNQSQDATNLANAQAQAQNARANIGTESAYRDQAMRDAVMASLMGGVQDVNITGLPEGVTMGNISGGLRPSAIQGKDALAARFKADAMQRYTDGPQGLVRDMPAATQPSKANWIDKLGNVASFLGGGAGMIGALKGGGDDGDYTNAPIAPTPQIDFGGNPFSGAEGAKRFELPSKLTAPRIRQSRVSFGGY